MITLQEKNRETQEFIVIHPLLDEPEAKLTGDGLGKMRMSRSLKVSLVLLRAYLIVMGLMLAYHMLDLAGVFARHVVR